MDHLTVTHEHDEASEQGRIKHWVHARRRAIADRAEAGLATAEYAIATVAAAAFAGVLLTLLSGDGVKGMLTSIVQKALTIG